MRLPLLVRVYTTLLKIIYDPVLRNERLFFIFSVLFMFLPYADMTIGNRARTRIQNTAYYILYRPGTIWCEKDLKVDIDKWGAHQVSRVYRFNICFFDTVESGYYIRVCVFEDLKYTYIYIYLCIFMKRRSHIWIRSRVIRFKYSD